MEPCFEQFGSKNKHVFFPEPRHNLAAKALRLLCRGEAPDCLGVSGSSGRAGWCANSIIAGFNVRMAAISTGGDDREREGERDL